MEKQGIITGIGNKITPEIDAVINDFVVLSNTLIRGLQLTVYPQHYYLSAGMCQLCGYRGVLLENIDLINAPYIYGKFVINFDESVPDSFSIFFAYDTNATNDGIVNPTAITQAGVYYLLLYVDGAKVVDDFHYPLCAETAEESYDLMDGVIAKTATTPTAPINDNSRRVANTEYVHKQIVEELGYEKQVVDISMNGVGYNLTFEKRARYCLISYNISVQSGQPPKTEFKVPRGFEPANNSETIIFIKGYTNVQYVYKLYVTTAGVASIVLVGSITMGTPSMGTLYAGYKI